MSTQPHPSTRRTLRILAITGLVGVLALGSLYGGWKARKALMVRRALATGLAAYEQGDWETARLNLGRYVSVHPDDAELLGKYAYAQLAVRPVKPENLHQALGAYRGVLRVQPGDDEAFRRLALLYETTGNFGELAHIATRRLEVLPDDPAAIIAQAKDLIFREKRDAAKATLEGLVGRLTEQRGSCDEFVEACGLLAGLTAAPGGPDAVARALAWLDQAVARCPDSGLALVQRAARRQAPAASQPAETAAQTAAARDDLERAEQLVELDPPVRLMLSEQWMMLREFDRAAAQLQAAKQAEWAALERFFVDPADWTAAVFIQEAKLALLTEDVAGGVARARSTLAELEGRPQRAAILPIAIELYVAGGHVAEARPCLDEYVEALKLRGRLAAGDEQLAWLRAVIARAENKPYEVIEQLAPVAGQPGARPMIRALLAEAYTRTGQAARAAQLLERTSVDAAANPELARLAARSQIVRGAWGDALGTLRAIENVRPDDPDTKALRLAAQLGVAYEQGEPGADALTEVTRDLAALRAAYPDRPMVRLLLATLAERRDGWEAAAEELKAAIDECGESLGLYRALARLYAGRGRVEEAQGTLQEACELYAERAVAWLDLSELLVDRQQVDAARATLKRGLQSVADGAGQTELRRRLGLLDLLRGDREAGIAALRELAAADPQDIPTRALLLELPEIVGDETTAAALVEEIKRTEGSNGVTWRLHEARLWLEQRDWRARRAAIEAHLKYCLDADPGLTAPVLLLGRLYEDLGDWAAAESTYRTALSRAGSVDVADRLLALLGRQRRFAEGRDLLQRMRQMLSAPALSARRLALDFGEQRYDSALRELQARTAGADRDPLDLVRLAWVSYAQDRNAAAALRYLDQAAEAGAAAVEVARVRVSLLQDQGRSEEVEAVLDELVNRQPSPEAFLLRAAYRSSIGQKERAEQDYAALASVAQNDYGVAVLGEFYAQAGQLDRAIEEWETGLRAYPDSLTLRRGLAKAYLTRGGAGDRERADELLAALERALPDDTDLMWVRAVEAAQLDTPESLARARELLKLAVQGAATRAEVYQGLCELALRLGDAPTARDLAVRGLQVHPGTTGLLLAQARAELLRGNLDAAREPARAARAADPQDVGTLEVLLEIATRQQDRPALRAGLAQLEEFIAARPTSDYLQVLRAQTHVALGDPDAARQTLAAFCATEAGRTSLPALLTLQDLHRLAADYAAAQQTLDAAAALAPGHAGVRHGRVLLLAAQGRFDDLAALMQGTEVKPEEADLLVSAATALAASPPHVSTAVALCQRARELAPRNVNALLALGDLEYQRGDATAAQQAYRAVLALQPNQPVALNNLAWVLAEAGAELEQALSAARQAVAAQPTDANYRDTLAFVLKRLGRLEDARAEYRRSADLTAPASAPRARVLLRLAQVCAELADWPAVEQCLKEALAVNNAQPIFAAEERAEIDRLLTAAQQD